MARGQASTDTTRGVDELAQAVRSTIAAKGYQDISESRDGREFRFVTKKTALNWELDGVATVTPGGSGSVLSVTLSGREGSPKALMDGWKTRKAAEKLAAEIVG
ncbi:MAG TPA: hypothetical protein H9805_09165 [Candidatus Janibacter merdipullorum]|nr:hypothetical protein [Candidatus Janibacter merdipullorum]